MAVERQDAIERCYTLGKRFIEHFHKIYKEGSDSDLFSHHCKEMQAWLNRCRSITLKSTNRPITTIELIDWFFTATGNIDEANGFKTQREIEVYNEFVSKLTVDREKSVISAAREVLGKGGDLNE